jgi:hypothetical protein
MCRKEEMVEEAEKKLRWVETILSVMDLVIPGMFRNSRKLSYPHPCGGKFGPLIQKRTYLKNVLCRISTTELFA